MGGMWIVGQQVQTIKDGFRVSGVFGVEEDDVADHGVVLDEDAYDLDGNDGRLNGDIGAGGDIQSRASLARGMAMKPQRWAIYACRALLSANEARPRKIAIPWGGLPASQR